MVSQEGEERLLVSFVSKKDNSIPFRSEVCCQGTANVKDHLGGVSKGACTLVNKELTMRIHCCAHQVGLAAVNASSGVFAHGGNDPFVTLDAGLGV